MITASVQIDPSEIEIDNLQIWQEHEPCEFWGSRYQVTETYVDWDGLVWMGEAIELDGDALSEFKSFILETYQ